MTLGTATYNVRADRNELAALLSGYASVFVAALAVILTTFRAAYIIAHQQPSINAFSYAETHTYILLVEVVMWMIMVRAAIRFKSYARRIMLSKDGSGLNLIADAMLLSFVYAVLFDIASSVKTLFMGTTYIQTVTTVTNLLPLAVFLLVSVLLFAGSLRLSRLVHGKPAFINHYQRLAALSLALFTVLIVPYGEYFYQVAPSILDDDGLRHFTLPHTTLIAVYLLPFIMVWLLGLLSCLKLVKYAHLVSGKIYKPKFRNLYLGILISYFSTFLIQIFYVSNLPSNRFGVGLIIIISLIVLIIIGYSLMYRGANQLYMLEKCPTI